MRTSEDTSVVVRKHGIIVTPLMLTTYCRPRSRSPRRRASPSPKRPYRRSRSPPANRRRSMSPRPNVRSPPRRKRSPSPPPREPDRHHAYRHSPEPKRRRLPSPRRSPRGPPERFTKRSSSPPNHYGPRDRDKRNTREGRLFYQGTRPVGLHHESDP